MLFYMGQCGLYQQKWSWQRTFIFQLFVTLLFLTWPISALDTPQLPSWACITFISTTTLIHSAYDSCHEKIDLFRVHNWVIHDLVWWKGSRVYQQEHLFSEWLTNFLLFWYQIYHSGSNRTDFTKVLRPKNYQNFEPRRGLFSRDTRHMCYVVPTNH